LFNSNPFPVPGKAGEGAQILAFSFLLRAIMKN